MLCHREITVTCAGIAKAFHNIGVEVSAILKQTEYCKHIVVCRDLLRLFEKES